MLVPLAGNATLRDGVILDELTLFVTPIANRSEGDVRPSLGNCLGIMTTALGVAPCTAYRAAKHHIGTVRLGNLNAEQWL